MPISQTNRQLSIGLGFEEKTNCYFNYIINKQLHLLSNSFLEVLNNNYILNKPIVFEIRNSIIFKTIKRQFET